MSKKPTSKKITKAPGNLPAPIDTSNPLATLLDAVRNRTDPVLIEKLYDIYSKMKADFARDRFNQAFVQAQGELPIVMKSNAVDFTSKRTDERTNYNYESLADVMTAVRPVLAKYGIGISQPVFNDEKSVTVSTILLGHGHETKPITLTGPIDLSGLKNQHQGIQSAQTYLRRATLKSALGIVAADEDDDAAATQVGPALSAEQVAEIEAELAPLEKRDPGYTKRLLKWVQNNTRGVTLEGVADIRAEHYQDVKEQLERKRTLLASAQSGMGPAPQQTGK